MKYFKFDLQPDEEKSQEDINTNSILNVIPHFTLIKAIKNVVIINEKKKEIERICDRYVHCNLSSICELFPDYCKSLK